ncbi:MAG TPA: hypothetical protein VIJ75_19415 [Hanamia sp.]
MRLLKFIILVFVVLVFSISSCQKGEISNSPVVLDSATIMGFKDSTQLVKSISQKFYDSLGNFVFSDSGTFFYYDTINRKVIISDQFVSSPDISHYLMSLSYNNNGMLIQAKFNITDDGSINQVRVVDYTYDEENIVNSQTFTFTKGNIETIPINKTSDLQDGYTLDFNVPITDFPDSTLYTISFDSSGRILSKSELYYPDLKSGTTHSFVYDADGNVSKMIEGFINGPNGATPSDTTTHTTFEFNGRDTKGNQLYNLNSLLFNGVASFLLNLGAAEFNGSLLDGFNDRYLCQFTKYPALNTKAWKSSPDSYVTFNPNPQYDNIGRLISYRLYGVGYANGHGYYSYEDQILTYYK